MVDHDDIWSDAIQEAYATADSDEVIISTLEFRYPTFLDPVRIVRDHGTYLRADGDLDVYGHTLTLESDAPVNAGESVEFQSCMFDFVEQERADGEMPGLQISMDNVGRILSPLLDAAVAIRANLDVTFRQYLASDVTGPGYVVKGLSMAKVRVNGSRVVGTARFQDFLNKSFPSKLYRPETYPGLVQ